MVEQTKSLRKPLILAACKQYHQVVNMLLKLTYMARHATCHLRSQSSFAPGGEWPMFVWFMTDPDQRELSGCRDHKRSYTALGDKEITYGE